MGCQIKWGKLNLENNDACSRSILLASAVTASRKQVLPPGLKGAMSWRSYKRKFQHA